MGLAHFPHQIPDGPVLRGCSQNLRMFFAVWLSGAWVIVSRPSGKTCLILPLRGVLSLPKHEVCYRVHHKTCISYISTHKLGESPTEAGDHMAPSHISSWVWHHPNMGTGQDSTLKQWTFRTYIPYHLFFNISLAISTLRNQPSGSSGYPLENSHITMERSTILNG